MVKDFAYQQKSEESHAINAASDKMGFKIKTILTRSHTLVQSCPTMCNTMDYSCQRQLMVNNVGFVISEEEDLALGPRIRLDHARAFVQQSFMKVGKGRKLLTQTSEQERRTPSPASFIRTLYTFFRPTPTTFIIN